MSHPLVYIGTYTEVLPHVHGSAEGVYVYRMDSATGALSYLNVGRGVVNPSFVALNADRSCLYAVEEVAEYHGGIGGVAAFALSDDGTTLTFINRQATHGAHPCYVSIDASGRWLLVANYSGGNVCVLPILPDGSLGPATAVVAHTGVARFHDGPHPHAFRQTPDQRWLLAPDCGLDRIAVYTLDQTHGTLTPNTPPWADTPAAAGPRHLDFHPTQPLVYCINERGLSLSVYQYDAAAGMLHELQTIDTLPAGMARSGSCADLHVHPSGRFVYGSNRGHNSIVAYAMQADGRLELLGHIATGGMTPRNFAIDPSGRFLLVANQDSNSVVTLRIDQETGMPHETGLVADVPSPVCLCFSMLQPG